MGTNSPSRCCKRPAYTIYSRVSRFQLIDCTIRKKLVNISWNGLVADNAEVSQAGPVCCAHVPTGRQVRGGPVAERENERANCGCVRPLSLQRTTASRQSVSADVLSSPPPLTRGTCTASGHNDRREGTGASTRRRSRLNERTPRVHCLGGSPCFHLLSPGAKRFAYAPAAAADQTFLTNNLIATGTRLFLSASMGAA